MADEPEILTAADLDAMTPDERADAFERRLVTDFDSLPDEFRERIVATAARLGKERRSSTVE